VTKQVGDDDLTRGRNPIMNKKLGGSEEETITNDDQFILVVGE